MIIRKQFDPIRLYAHPTSEVEEHDFRLTRDNNFNCHYTDVGSRNIDEYVESFKNGCSLESLLARCNLMPAKDKISYLQRTAGGVGADFIHMPKDLTEAFIQYGNIARENPELIKRLNAGESMDSIIKSILAANSATQDSNKEVINNGQDEPGNE